MEFVDGTDAARLLLSGAVSPELAVDIVWAGGAGTADRFRNRHGPGRGHRVDRRADVHSLGCTLFHLLTGEIPYPVRNSAQLIHGHAHLPVPVPI
ncbi:hypothetical protein GPX89_25075 [Nocardia sp. ET3-3]|uniref:Protein kinase domain-containing protein n=1 Tax=Nocardia terrae TaxID=2675851 RepID=A0A7K1V244_9NOCA|nr:hypothetical protein [Nocardia terrae]MVU80509.1 hypothetical protein [Nocardia terrae]